MPCLFPSRSGFKLPFIGWPSLPVFSPDSRKKNKGVARVDRHPRLPSSLTAPQRRHRLSNRPIHDMDRLPIHRKIHRLRLALYQATAQCRPKSRSVHVGVRTESQVWCGGHRPEKRNPVTDDRQAFPAEIVIEIEIVQTTFSAIGTARQFVCLSA